MSGLTLPAISNLELLEHAGIPEDSPGATGWEMAFDKLPFPL